MIGPSGGLIDGIARAIAEEVARTLNAIHGHNRPDPTEVEVARFDVEVLLTRDGKATRVRLATGQETDR